MSFTLVHVDAFTRVAFSGNAAAVCVLDRAPDPAWMQRLAAEANLAATAFLWPVADAYGLRWFSPTTELALCGHGTLAGAHVRWESGRLADDAAARFETSAGLLLATKREDWIEIDLPAAVAAEATAPAGLLEALGIPAIRVARGPRDFLVEVESETVVRDVAPDFARLRLVPTRGVIVTSRSAEPGVDEDPVTGSAHCCLGPYWRERLGKDEFRARQVSRRGGEVRVSVAGDRVLVSGQAVTVWTSDLASTVEEAAAWT